MKNITKTISIFDIDTEDCPIPLDTIPNLMGINLVSVESISWTEQPDGQLVDFSIKFLPNNNKIYHYIKTSGLDKLADYLDDDQFNITQAKIEYFCHLIVEHCAEVCDNLQERRASMSSTEIAAVIRNIKSDLIV